MARLTSPTGASVEVVDAKADELVRRGFTPEKAPAKKAAATKKAATGSNAEPTK